MTPQVDRVPLSTSRKTVDPRGTDSPPDGLWDRTEPGSMHAFVVDTLGVRPRAEMMLVAWARGNPQTLGTTTVGWFTAREKLASLTKALASSTPTLTVYTPAALGAPLIRPAADTVTPGGRTTP